MQRKKDFPVHEVRRFLEPGPVVLLSSAYKGQVNVMTLGWHMVMEFSPSLVGCIIAPGNATHEMAKRSKGCVINLPASALIDKVVAIGNSSGSEIDKFARFGLTPVPATEVAAPLVAECHANFECRLHDGSRIGKYGLFIWEVVKAHVAVSPKIPETIHYRGDGQFMVSGKEISRRAAFRPGML